MVVIHVKRWNDFPANLAAAFKRGLVFFGLDTILHEPARLARLAPTLAAIYGVGSLEPSVPAAKGDFPAAEDAGSRIGTRRDGRGGVPLLCAPPAPRLLSLAAGRTVLAAAIVRPALRAANHADLLSRPHARWLGAGGPDGLAVELANVVVGGDQSGTAVNAAFGFALFRAVSSTLGCGHVDTARFARAEWVAGLRPALVVHGAPSARMGALCTVVD